MKPVVHSGAPRPLSVRSSSPASYGGYWLRRACVVVSVRTGTNWMASAFAGIAEDSADCAPRFAASTALTTTTLLFAVSMWMK